MQSACTRAVAAAGFNGLKCYNPVQKAAKAPDAVVWMLDTVMQATDTWATVVLDIDDAIEASDKFFQSAQGKGKQSATSMFKCT